MASVQVTSMSWEETLEKDAGRRGKMGRDMPSPGLKPTPE